MSQWPTASAASCSQSTSAFGPLFRPPAEKLLAAPEPPPPSAGSQAPPRLRSCASCRLRRVKCDRAGRGNADCVQCIAKSLLCTPMPKQSRKTPVRTGKRINEARATFGTRPEQIHGPASSNAQDPSPSRGEVITSNALDPTSASSRLITTELQSAVTTTLLDFYLTTQPPNPFVDSTAFQTSFQLAGCRIDALDNQSQVLCSLIIALGARCCDHPAFVGPNAPKLADLASASKTGKDLREFGRRRESACEVLRYKAIELADRMGTMRIATQESMASLMIMESMGDQDDFATYRERPFVLAYNGHARTLLEGGTDLNSAMGWTSYIRDAMKSAATGYAPCFSEEDVFLLRKGEEESALPLENAIRVGLSPDPMLNFGRLLRSYMFALGDFARTVHLKLTGLRARQAARINETFAQEFLVFLDHASEALRLLEARAELLPPQILAPERPGIIRSLKMTFYQLTFCLNHAVGTRISARWDTISGGSLGTQGHVSPASTNDEEEYWLRLVVLRREVYNRAFMASRGIAQLLGDALENGMVLGRMDWLDHRATQMIFSTLPSWLSLIVDTPTSEEGGPADFTFATKLQDLRWALNSLFSIGWSHEKLSRPTSWVEEEITKLEARRHHFFQPPSSQASNPFDAHPQPYPLEPHFSLHTPDVPPTPNTGLPGASPSFPSTSSPYYTPTPSNTSPLDDETSFAGVSTDFLTDLFFSQPLAPAFEGHDVSSPGLFHLEQGYTDEDFQLLLGGLVKATRSRRTLARNFDMLTIAFYISCNA